MRPAYSRIAWGLALVLIDIRLISFDLLPDSLGYFLIVIGLAGMRPDNKRFAIGRKAAGILTLLALPQLIGIVWTLNLNDPQLPGMAPMLLMAVVTALELVMLYGICMGIREQALSAGGSEQLAYSARRIWQTIFALGAVMLFSQPFILNAETSTMVPLQIAFGFIYFIACLWVIALVRRAGKQFGNSDGNSDFSYSAQPTAQHNHTEK